MSDVSDDQTIDYSVDDVFEVMSLETDEEVEESIQPNGNQSKDVNEDNESLVSKPITKSKRRRRKRCEVLDQLNSDSISSSSSKCRTNKVSNIDFRFSFWLRETHGLPLYGIQFNQHLPEGHHYFATVGTNRITVYECLKDYSIRLVQCYADTDTNECFYTCVWSYNDVTGSPLLAAAGSRGIIRIINNADQKCVKHFIGHGHAINDLKVSPLDANLLLSASKDHSLRLWNMKTDQCVAIFDGIEGHRDQVLSADFHLMGHKIISSGMDHSLKIWSLDKEEIQTAIRMSYTYNESTANNPFHTVREHFPLFTTRDIHSDYVDCVQWLGNFVLSKSCKDEMVCWKPSKRDDENDIEILSSYSLNTTSTEIHRFDVKECRFWFMKFATDANQKLLALGNQKGKAYVWELDVDDLKNVRCATLTHPKCTTAIRQTCFNSDGSILLCVCEDSSVWRWDHHNDNMTSIGQ